MLFTNIIRYFFELESFAIISVCPEKLNPARFNAFLETGAVHIAWAFWAKRDPTPKTLYNELMAEYYRRVDYAYINFATLRERDGARTDKGKVYILYGQPTKIERKYTPGRPTEEIWYYEPIRRKFVFTDQYGSFKLTSVETYEP